MSCLMGLILGFCSSCQDRPDCADWGRQQYHTCEIFGFLSFNPFTLQMSCTCETFRFLSFNPSFHISNVLQEVNKLMGTLPPAIQALTGVDLTGVRILSSSFVCLFINDMSNTQFDGGSEPKNARATIPVQRPSMGVSNQLRPTTTARDELAWSSISLTSSPSPHSSHTKPLSVGPLHLH